MYFTDGMTAARPSSSLPANRFINPVMTVVVGLLIASMMIACFLPVFQMGGAV